MTKYTENQQKVIDHNEGNIVVSASAGSGKTSVMIERIIRLILEGKVDINQVLAVTFTKATATEIKEKIAKAIYRSINENNADRLKKQIEDLPLASVSTVDSFCANLVKKYFYLCDIDANFSVLAQEDQLELSKRAVKEVFDELYESEDEDLIELLSVFASKRSDEKLQKLVLEMYDFAINEKDPDAFFQRSIDNYSENNLKTIVNRFIDKLFIVFHCFCESLEEICKRCLDNGFCETYNSLSDVLSMVDNVKYHKNVEEFKSYISEIKCKAISRKFAVDSEVYRAVVEDYNEWRAKLDKLIKSISVVFENTEEENKKMTLAVGENMSRLVKIIKLFEKKYQKIKNDYSVLDYQDIEHFAMKVLENEQICNEIKGQYKYIFVDEYQDTNGIQEAIFEKISNNNLFIVGDIKQSIYAFRGCNPHIFMGKIEACKRGYGLHVNLDDNFRSAKSVIDGVNGIFSKVMLSENADVDYAQNLMKGGSLYGDYQGECYLHVCPSEKQKVVEIDGVYSVGKHLQKLNDNKGFGEERTIAEIILAKLGKPIFDIKKQETRPLQYSDFVVLTRSNKGVADKILNELVQFGIPVISQSNRSIKNYPEVAVMINLVKFIVSPKNDVALATVLKSAIGGFSDEELSCIRKENQADSFYDACKKATENGEFKDRLNEFFTYFNEIRVLSQFENASLILNKIICERNYQLQLLANKLGEIKLARVNRFITAGANLSIFELDEKMDSITSAMTVSSSGGDDAVRIMSMHSSKGLEFPVVIVAQVSKRFNIKPNSEEIVFDRNLGFGLYYYDKEKRIKKKSILRKMIEFSFRLDLPAEEMRLFYVATTRAKNELHVITDELPSRNHRYESFYQALYMSDFLSQSDMPIIDDSESVTNEIQKQDERELIIGSFDNEQVKQISKFMSFEYKYLPDTTLPLKRSVTEIVKNQNVAVDEDEVYFEKQPLFVGNLEEVGTGYHKFLELCDFSKDSSQLSDLIGNGLDGETAELLDKKQLDKILKMDVFSRVVGLQLYKEQKFILNVPSSLVSDENSSEEVLVQGIIDLLAVDKDGAFVIDYKFSKKSPSALKNTYQKQLKLYAYAVEKILKTKIKSMILVNIRTAEEIEVD